MTNDNVVNFGDEKFIADCKKTFGNENVTVAYSVDQVAQQLAMKEARRAYQREWRRKNPDKVRAQNERYWEKKGQEFLQKMMEGKNYE